MTLWFAIQKCGAKDFRAKLFAGPGHFSAFWSRRMASPSDLKRELRRAGFDLRWEAWPHTSWEGFGDKEIKWIARVDPKRCEERTKE